MHIKFFKNISVTDFILFAIPVGAILVAIIYFGYKHVAPAPPDHFTISTGDDQSDLQVYANEYKDILKAEGVRLDIVPSEGPLENLKRLQDENSGVAAAFVQDGLGSTDQQPDVSSLGSLYYEPIWVFYHSRSNFTHLSQLSGKKISVGRLGRGTQILATRLLKLSGVDLSKTTLINLPSEAAAVALKRGLIDAAIIMQPANSDVVHDLILDSDLHLMNIQQSEAIARRDAAFHHLVLPRGALDLKNDLPREDVNLLSSTATLLVRDDLHPALAYLLLKAMTQVHSAPGIFEKRSEFPSNKDDQFPLSDDAIQYYKSGGPFWQRYLPYWLAAWVDRFLLLVIPFFAFVLPMLRTIPRAYEWRIRNRIYQRYGELKFLETEIKPEVTASELAHYHSQLNSIEERVNRMKTPQKFTEYIYSLRGHIQFVRDRLDKTVTVKS